MEWKTVKLGDVCTLLTGFPFKGDLYAKDGIRVLRGENIGDKELHFDDRSDKRWNLSFDKADYYSLREKDIVMQMDGNVGKNKAKLLLSDLPMLIAQRVACVRANELSDQDFLYYIIIGSSFHQYLDSVKTGTSIQHISLKQIGDFQFALPPLAEQKRIAAILSSLDAKIENNNRINRNLEAQAQALYKSWFVDFEPWGGKMPEDWKEGSIYNYVDVIYGAPYKSALFNEHNEGVPLIRIRDLKTNSPQVSTTEILPNTEYIEAGDIVAGMDAEFSPYLWKGEKGLLNQRCCKFKANESSISNYYVLFLVKPELEYVQSYKTGTTVSHLGKADIDRFNVIIPPIEIVRKFSTQVDAMKELVVSNALESARLAALRDTLLPKLMKGEIEV